MYMSRITTNLTAPIAGAPGKGPPSKPCAPSSSEGANPRDGNGHNYLHQLGRSIGPHKKHWFFSFLTRARGGPGAPGRNPKALRGPSRGLRGPPGGFRTNRKPNQKT